MSLPWLSFRHLVCFLLIHLAPRPFVLSQDPLRELERIPSPLVLSIHFLPIFSSSSRLPCLYSLHPSSKMMHRLIAFRSRLFPRHAILTSFGEQDFLASDLDRKAQAALAHLRELTPFTCVLGSYPRNSKLVGPISEELEVLSRGAPDQVRDVTGSCFTLGSVTSRELSG